jgi:hypothetical protein
MINNSEFLIGKIPNFHPIADRYEAREWWREMKRRCVEGYWVGGKWMPPELFYYVNFHNIKYESGDGVSKAIGLPWLRDIEWEKAYIYAEATGFSGFGSDPKYTCDRKYGPDQELALKLGKISVEEIRTKEYMDVRDYLSRPYLTSMDKPLFRNTARNVMDLEGRGGGKSYWASGCITHNFLFDGARDYDLYLERREANEPFVSETVVGSIDAKYSNDLLDKVKTGVSMLPGKMSLLTIDGEMEEYPSPLSVRYTGSLASGKKWVNSNGSMLHHRTFQDNALAANGTRPNRVFLEEVGFMSNILESWGAIEATQEGEEHNRLTIYGLGTGGLTSAGAALYCQEIFYNPEAYNCLSFDNTYENKGGRMKKMGYFLPAQKTKNKFKKGPNKITDFALATEVITKEIEEAKNSGSRTKYLAKVINSPLVPSDIFLRAEGVFFPISELKEALANLEANQLLLDASYKVDLRFVEGKVHMYPSDMYPIRDFPLRKGSLMDACIEIFEKPKTNSQGVIDPSRYIIATDPVDDDGNDDVTRSLQSTFVLDTLTLRIVAEYTARTYLAETYYENVRKLALYYNSQILYENNKKGLYGHFKNKNALWMLIETPQILRDQELVKSVGIGNRALGVNVNDGVKLYGIKLILKYLERDSYSSTEKKNLHTIRSVGLLKELIAYSLDINADRVSAMIVLMIYLEELGERTTENMKKKQQTMAKDEFWSRAYGNSGPKVYNKETNSFKEGY